MHAKKCDAHVYGKHLGVLAVHVQAWLITQGEKSDKLLCRYSDDFSASLQARLLGSHAYSLLD